MKNQTNTTPVIRSGFALALALAIWSPAHAQSTEPAKGQAMTAAAMMERCQEMKQQKQDMKDDIKAQDAQLTEQLANMNRAPEAQKTDLMAAVLTHMVEQRIVMDARKAQMEEAMMQHMMQHMQMGKESISQCPMMKDMKDVAGTSAGAEKEHREGQD
jgi:predicted component of type VI protein secretion system